jgi:transcriptional regulator with XRE-family HTH domain
MVKKSISKISSSPSITAAQLRAARALLGWSQQELANSSGVSKPTIARLELETGPRGGYESTQFKLVAAFESAGVEFLNHGHPGVRMK